MLRCSKRINNKGMSLVELLIAVTILAIIVVPLLHSFVSSARINRKAKITQKLTTMGQDVMEGLKAYNVEDLAYEFDYPTVSSCNAHPSGFQLIKPDLVGANSTEVASRVYELASTGVDTYMKVNATTTPAQSILVSGAGPSTEYKFDKEASKGKTYYFAVSNVSSERSTTSSYKADILIKIDPSKYTTAGGSISSNKALHNEDSLTDKKLADLYSMDTTRDAFFLESGKQINDAYNKLISKGATIASAEDIYKKIEVEISDDGAGKKVTYKFRYGAPGVDANDASDPDPVVFPTNITLSTLKYAELDNIYLFYLPSYGSTGDTINYINNTSDSFTFTLVKRQITEQDGVEVPAGTKYKVDDYATLNSRELTYKCTVNVNDTDTILRTNVKTNLASMIPDPANIGGSANILTDTLTLVNLPSGITNKTIAGEKKEDRIFDVTIDIYEPGTLDAAISAGAALPADKHLVTVKGNMN